MGAWQLLDSSRLNWGSSSCVPGRQMCAGMESKEALSRARWVSVLLLESLQNAAEPPGSRTHRHCLADDFHVAVKAIGVLPDFAKT